ncbi:DctP family TRAP transporter solute-binding subunit [Peribacillus asahii]|uniref:DctP family TRAP transporter solute-binding subunit n=1 Tax=Peribacillus asahii TaxID=228899 RepID=UPI0038260B61
MRAFWGYFALISLGLILAIFIAFQSLFSKEDVRKDYEQVGMKDQIIIKFSHVVAENTPKGLAAVHFAKLVDEYTNHRVKVEVFPNQSLYGDQEEIKALLENKVQMIAPSTSTLTDLSPKWLLLDLPYIFPNRDALEEALYGEVGEELLHDLERHHIKGMALWTNHFKQITSNTPIYTTADFEGRTFRIMPSKVLKEQFEHFGASTLMLRFNETFANLEQNKTDSQENTISNIYSKKLYRLQNYLTISNHGFLGYGVLMNQQFWDELPPDIQVQIQRAMQETTEWLWTKSDEMNRQLLLEIERSSSISMYKLSPAEKKQWMNEMTVIYPKFEPIIGTELMDKMKVIREKHIK